MKKNLTIIFSIVILFTNACSQKIVGNGKLVNPYEYTTVKDSIYKISAVSSAHPIASAVGATIMNKGGNAFDAAIATQLALAVVYPGAGNIGGGGFMVSRSKNGETLSLDFRETAPAKASRDMYINDKGEAQTILSQNGHLAAGVPGTIAGLFATLKYAKLPFTKLIQPAIDLAENGFTISENEARKMNDKQELFKKYNTQPNVFFKENWKEGDTLIQKDLAKTLRTISDKGQAGFYEGDVAKLIVDEMKRGNGMITLEDLKSYKVVWRKPIEFDYKGHTIITMPAPSSGGLLLAQMLKMVEDRPLPMYGFETVKSVQLMTEVERRAYADRAEHMGDPDFWKVPAETLMSKEYLTKRMLDYDSTKASKSTDVNAGIIESTETTHISIADKEGNLVSVTTTLNGTFGSKTVVGGAGFILNNEMDDFSIKPGVKNMFGAIGGDANAIAPGKRMLSSMTPTIVLKNNKPFMVVGTPGGTTIPTSIFQIIVDVIDFEMSPKVAVEKPRFHHQWIPDQLVVEKGFDENVMKQLERMGHDVKYYMVAGYSSTIGRVELLQINKGSITAIADSRGDDGVAGK